MEAFRLTCYGNEINNNKKNILVMPALLSSFLLSIMNCAIYFFRLYQLLECADSITDMTSKCPNTLKRLRQY